MHNTCTLQTKNVYIRRKQFLGLMELPWKERKHPFKMCLREGFALLFRCCCSVYLKKENEMNARVVEGEEYEAIAKKKKNLSPKKRGIFHFPCTHLAQNIYSM